MPIISSVDLSPNTSLCESVQHYVCTTLLFEVPHSKTFHATCLNNIYCVKEWKCEVNAELPLKSVLVDMD